MYACARSYLCFTVDGSDRFGQHGLVGLVVAEERPRPLTEAEAAAHLASADTERTGGGGAGRAGGAGGTGGTGSAGGVGGMGCTVGAGTAGGAGGAVDDADGVDGGGDGGCASVLEVQCWLLSCRSLHVVHPSVLSP